MATVTFRFYEELNDFLPSSRRKRDFGYACVRGETVKHAIEALGVPHTEVELILVDGESVGFDRILADGDRIAVYPVFEAFDVAPLLRLREHPLRVTRFVADAHLGALAAKLRMAGFDTLYDNHFDDDEIEALAVGGRRIVLSRDRELLKRRAITHGCYVHALKPDAQLRELFARLDLFASARPFTLCMACNAPLREIARREVETRVPPDVFAGHERFVTCDVCRRVYWEGSHWRRMRGLLDALASR
ncbi:Mut7-C RNAse domain-containing protein [Crenobacter cavernae]|uniref:Twitching motility protein PilT n=1 Tax=Crenobacter cavernae TaxID=2290923 RepID=A0ABY0FAA0_9NEIS|nr:Mut7-C RNAse domain-containing protein [Crenobacter cavernae]RXZ42566.1 twitching motility protein PilT [Crenobacter cavernae]